MLIVMFPPRHGSVAPPVRLKALKADGGYRQVDEHLAGKVRERGCWLFGLRSLISGVMLLCRAVYLPTSGVPQSQAEGRDGLVAQVPGPWS